MEPRPYAITIVLSLVAMGLTGCFGPGAAPTSDPSAPGPPSASRLPDVSGDFQFDRSFSVVLEAGPLERLPPVLEHLRSDVDGVDIEVGYWLPDVPDGTQVPVLLHASPYHRPAGTVVSNSGLKAFLTSNFLPHGYAVAAVSVRGTGNSGGCMELMGPREVADLDQAITWLAEQPWSNGNVGMIGLSYDGSTPWMAASAGNPHLKTIVPISGVNDLYSLMYKNGSAEMRGPILLNLLYYEYGWNLVTPLGGGGDLERDPEKRVEGLVCPDAWEGIAWSLYSGVHGGRDPMGWWTERNLRIGVGQAYEGSILSVQGLQDWNVDPSMALPWVDDLNRSGVFVHQLLGQWGHTMPDRKGASSSPGALHRMDWAQTLYHWFDYWLRDNTSAPLGPAVQVQDNTFRWRVEDHWPPRDAQWVQYHLAQGSSLSQETGPAGAMMLLPNPAAENPLMGELSNLPGYAADFYTEPLDRTVNIAGLPRVHVTVVPQGVTGHVAAWLYDVAPNGQERRIGWTTMNLRFHDGTEQEKTLTPGEPILAKLEIQPMDARIEAGHRVLLRIWQYSSEEHIGGPSLKDRALAYPPAPVELRFGGQAHSVVEIPFVERGPEEYFRPPMPEGYRYPYEN